MPYSDTMPRLKWFFFIGALMLFGVYLSSLHSYLLFHSMAEIFSVLVSFSIFLFAWNTSGFVKDDFLIVLGTAFLFIGFFDLMHTLAYKGMHVIATDDADHATQMWIIARYLQSLSMLAVTFLFKRRVNYLLVAAGYTVISAVLFLSVFKFHFFPHCYIENVGLTPFKIVSEYLICAILLAAGIRIYSRRLEIDPVMNRLLLASIGFSIATDLAFTLYVDVYGIANLIGHLLKIVSFYLVYRAIVAHGLLKPYRSMFRELSENKMLLERYSQQLETRVAERTRQLEASNRELRNLSDQLVTAEESERHRIARDLHDSIGQSLSAIKFFVETAVFNLGDRLNSQDRNHLEKLVPMIKSAIDDVRRIIRNLRPSIINDLGLVAGISWLCREFGAVYTEVVVQRHLELVEHELPEEIKDPAFRFLQEALNNIGKHSGARAVTVILARRNGCICFEVNDDGKGFDAGAVLNARSKGTGFGLAGMRERAELSGAEFTIDSRPGEGTRIRAAWPAQDEPGQPDADGFELAR